MYFGKYQHAIDEKNRITVPAKFRETLGDKVFLTFINGTNSIIIRNQKDFHAFQQELIKNSDISSDIKKIIMANTFDQTLDKNGRINLPIDLIKNANLSKNIYFIGGGNRIELWDSKQWNEFHDNIDKKIIEKIKDIY